MFSRETLPSITTLECICNAFGITMSDFFADDIEYESQNKEQELLNLYRALPEKTKKSIISLLNAISDK